MVRVLIFSLILFSANWVKAATSYREVAELTSIQNDLDNTDSLKRLPADKVKVGLKFAYAELLYQRLYGVDKFAVNGDHVAEPLKKAVAQAKYRESALDVMGAEGWELSMGIMREVNGGYEILYYLKKKID